MRECGILLPVSCLPSKYGIGSFSKEAYRFADLLAAAGQKYWQILPLGPTGYGDSPYQSFSSFAGSPYYIDLEQLIDMDYLTMEDCDCCNFGSNERSIDYEKLFLWRFKVLKKAYKNSRIDKQPDYQAFVEENRYWLYDYSLYMAVKKHFRHKSFLEWPEDIRLRTPQALKHYDDLLQNEIGFYQFLQYLFFSQWNKLKAYVNKKGIRIIGDIPIYVSYDSADTWAQPSLFQLDEDLTPIAVAGCPPDAFSATGQLWGNPLYRWEYHKESGYQWWTRRIAHCFRLYDVVRVDHFRGFDEYYSIPYGDATAAKGTWKKGPGYDIFHTLTKALGSLDIIAEDLGFLTDSVSALVEESGYPGMKVLQFAFDSREAADYLPHNYDKNCVVYTGTHDNDTLLGWYEAIDEKDRLLALEYLNREDAPDLDIHWDIIRLALGCVARIAIIPMQDYLGLPASARINTPSTLGDNWRWRMLPGEFTNALSAKIRHLAKLYGRL